MELAGSILQLVLPFISPILTTLGSFALYYYSQNKYKRDIIRAIFAETEMGFEGNKIKNLLQIKYIVEVIKFIVYFAFIVIYLIMNYSSLQTLQTINQKAIVSSFVSCLNTIIISSNASSLHIVNISSFASTYIIIAIITIEIALINYGLYYLIFFSIQFLIIRLIFFSIQTFIFRFKKTGKGGKWHYYLYIPFISFSPTTLDLGLGTIFYLSFNSYLYVTLFNLDILGKCFKEILFFSLSALVLILAVYIYLYILFALLRFLQTIGLGKDKCKSDKNEYKDKYEEIDILLMFENIDSLIFQSSPDKPRIRVRVGSAVYEGEVKEIGRNLVIVSIDKQLNVIVDHIRWEKIDTVEVIK